MELVLVPGLRLGMVDARGRGPRRLDGTGPPLLVASAANELEHAEREARALLECFPDAHLLTGAEASAGEFLHRARQAAWIHFAGHGLFRADAPHESALRFTDRWLTAGEMAGLELAASWVTLSACQTARALVRPGEEWFGIARALLLAGARRVIASQWDVEDEAAAPLMIDLYRRVAAGDPLERALALAQSSQARDGRHPFEWSGFVLLGSPTAPGSGRARGDPDSKDEACFSATSPASGGLV